MSKNKELKEDKNKPDESMKKYCVSLGIKVREERKLRNLSIETLSEFLDLSPSYIGLLERGERCPSLKSLMSICELLGGTPNDFLYYKSDNTKLTFSETNEEAEKIKHNRENKLKAINSLSQKLDDSELDFLIDVIKNLNKLSKSKKLDFYDYDIDF